MNHCLAQLRVAKLDRKISDIDEKLEKHRADLKLATEDRSEWEKQKQDLKQRLE